MDAPAHYTVRRADPATSSASTIDVREKLGGVLEEHYEKTFAIVLEQRRRGESWKPLASIDVFHPDEPIEDDTPIEIRREELVEQVLLEAEGDGTDSAREVKAYGIGERKHKIVWRPIVWTVGEGAFAATPIEQRDSTLAGALIVLARVNEAQGRSLEQAYTRSDKAQEKSLVIVASVLDKLDKVVATVSTSLDGLVIARNQASSSALAMRQADVDELEVKNRHAEEMARQESDDALTMFALETLARVYMTDDDDDDDDDDTGEKKKAKKDGDPIDVEASEAGDAGDGSSSSSSSSSSSPADNKVRKVRRGHGPRCKEAADLARIFDSLSARRAEKVREVLSQNEWDAMEEATRCGTLQQFDAAFGRAAKAIRSRDDGGVALMHQLAPLIRGHGLTLMRLTQDFEARHPSG